MTLLIILKQNHPQILSIDCTLNIIREKHIINLHVSSVKKFLSQSFRVFSILYNENQSDAFPENFPTIKVKLKRLMGKQKVPIANVLLDRSGYATALVVCYFV